MNPLISVIIPVYNVKEYLDKCISTVINQTYSNLEIILIDDGSTDGSTQKCDEWARKDSRIKVIHKKNGGVSSARNQGLEVATGDFIGFVDPDDWISLEMYQIMLREAVNNQVDAVFVSYSRVNSNGEKIKAAPVSQGLVNKENAMVAALNTGYFVTVWNKLFRAKVCNGKMAVNNVKFTNISRSEDEVWLFDVLKSCNKIALINQSLYFWRIRENSATEVACLTPDKLNLIKVKEYVYTIAREAGNKAAIAARINQYMNAYSLMLEAYMCGNIIALNLTKNLMKDYRNTWFGSEKSSIGKIKRGLVELLINIHFPKKMINFIDHLSK